MNLYTWLELWVIASFLGAVTSLWAIWVVRDDMSERSKAFANGTRVLGIALVLVEGIRFFIQSLWFVIGIISHYTLRPEVAAAPPPTPIVPILVLTNVLILIKTLVWLRARSQVAKGRSTLWGSK
jgi:hypothetical protein